MTKKRWFLVGAEAGPVNLDYVQSRIVDLINELNRSGDVASADLTFIADNAVQTTLGHGEAAIPGHVVTLIGHPGGFPATSREAEDCG